MVFSKVFLAVTINKAAGFFIAPFMAATMFTTMCALPQVENFYYFYLMAFLLLCLHPVTQVSFARFDSEFLQSPGCDVFVAGFPCQPFSAGGSGRGQLDPRGTVVFRLITWISLHLPTIFVLENVLGLLERHPDTLYEILRLLVEIGPYEVSWSVLGAHTHGNVPQHRERIFICGVLRSKLVTPLQWPSTIPLTTELSDFIDEDGQVHEEVQWPGTKTNKRNLKDAIVNIITKNGENPLETQYVIDLDCGPSRRPCYSTVLYNLFYIICFLHQVSLNLSVLS